MDESTEERGVAMALLERFQTQRLPRALAIKERIDRGGLLDDFDITFLETVFREFANVRTMVDKHPEYEPLVAQVLHLYHEITVKALENEKTKGD
jgi:hypothetical protein